MPENRRPLSRLLLPLLLLVFVFQCGYFHVSGVDVGFHIRTGQQVVDSAAIPSINTFSFSCPKEPWLLHQWAPGVLYYLAYRYGGVAGLVAFKAALGCLIFLAVWLCARRETGPASYWPFWAVSAAAVLARVRFFERPFMFSALLLALLLFFSRRHAGRRSWQWAGMPLLMAVWANTHAGVIYGFVLLGALAGAEWAEWLWRHVRGHKGDSPGALSLFRLPIGIVLSVAAAVVSTWAINPSGPRVLLAPFNYFFETFWKDLIIELQPATGPLAVMLYAYIAVLAALHFFGRRRIDLALLAISALFAFLACRAQRSVLMFAVVSAPYAARLLESAWPVRRPSLRLVHAGLLLPAWLLVTLAVIVPDRSARYGPGLYPPYYPMRIYSFMSREVPRQNVYNDMMYGGSMLWFLYPEFRPFMDGRGEAYSLEFWRDVYTPVSHGRPLWREVFRRHDIGGALVSNRMGRPAGELARQLYEEDDWALVAFDDSALLFLKRSAGNESVIDSHEYRAIWPGDWSFSGVTPETAAEALAEARRARSADPDGVFAGTAEARACMVAGDYAAAIDIYATLATGPRAGANYRRDYGYCLFMAGRTREAGEVFTGMMEADMHPGFACYMLHYLAAREGNTAEADRLLTRALQIEPENPAYLEARAKLDRALDGK